jgi:hypothetical protein
LEEVSLNWTARGAVPVVMFEVNDATGVYTGTFTVTDCVAELLPALLLAVRFTVNVPAAV